MVNKIKQNWCKIILVFIQVTFLGGGHVYLAQLNDFKKEIVKQVDRAESIVNSVNKTGNSVITSVEKVNKKLKEVKKACKKIKL